MKPRVYCQSKFFFSLVKASQSIHHHGRLGVILKTSVIPDSLFINNKQLYHACISCLISPKVLPCERFGFLAIFDKTSQLAIAYHTNRTVSWFIVNAMGYYLILCSEMSPQLCIIEENQNFSYSDSFTKVNFWVVFQQQKKNL